ncbi:MAG TPA: ribosome biogenesis GTP-binding protein YihA/YsxC [Clostridia bacterium]|jgi:GTP-binding protein|nr:ribosome biogenesis GTP-binding protein YihA/YsxC [Clostridia bacterium]
MTTIKKTRLFKIIGENSNYPIFSVPTIAFVGRSNVGKSSLINSITGIKKLAYVSKEPGKTKTINYYECNDGAFYLIDLPGYGYARVSNATKRSWSSMMDRFFKAVNNISLVLLLIDARRDVSDNDRMMINFLYCNRIPFIVILTKIDLIKRVNINQCTSKIANQLGIGIDNVFVYSSITKEGKVELIKLLENKIGTKIT